MRRPYRTEGLTPRDRLIIGIERRLGQDPSAQAAKLEAAAQHGIDARTYSFVVAALIDDPRANAEDPTTMSRLREIRDRNRDAFDAGEPQPRHRPFGF